MSEGLATKVFAFKPRRRRRRAGAVNHEVLFELPPTRLILS